MKIRLQKTHDMLELRVQETPDSYWYHVFRLDKNGILLSSGVVADSLSLTSESHWAGRRITEE